MARFLAPCLVVALLAGCVANAPVPPASTPRPSQTSVSVRRSPAPTPAPTATPAIVATPEATRGLAADRRTAIAQALRDMVPTSRASRVTETFGEINGVLAQNGARIISDNGGGIISDNGGGYRLLTVYDIVKGALVYVIDARTETEGGFKTFDRPKYEALPAERRDEALIDEFVWDDVTYEQQYKGDPLMLAMTYKMRKLRSPRILIDEKLESRQLFRLSPTGSGLLAAAAGWDISFSLGVPVVGGGTDSAAFVASAGEADIDIVDDSQGGTLGLPHRLTLAGTADRGAYTGEVQYGDGVHMTFDFTGKDGSRARLVSKTGADGTREQTTTAVGADVRVVAVTRADGTGEGTIEDVTTGARVGTVTISGAGVASLSFGAGELLEVQAY